MRCRLTRLGLLRRRRGKLVEEDHGGVLMAEFRRRTRAEGVREENCLHVHAHKRARARSQVPRCSPKCGTRSASSSRGLLGSSGTRATTATSRVNLPWLDRSRVQSLGTANVWFDQRRSRRSAQCASDSQLIVPLHGLIGGRMGGHRHFGAPESLRASPITHHPF